MEAAAAAAVAAAWGGGGQHPDNINLLNSNPVYS
jgi:hypothetical protein